MQGLTVQGVSRDRLTPRPNENITVPDEVGRAIVRRNLARQFTESRIAIALVGLGLRPAALTVRGLARAMITTAGLARVAASLPPTDESQSTPIAALPSDDLGIPEAFARSPRVVDRGVLVDDNPVIEDLADTNEDMDIEL